MVEAKSGELKILFFIESLQAGGKERRLTELLKVLKYSEGIDFEIVVMNSEIHYREILDINIKIHFLIRKTKKDLSVFRKFYKICKDYKPDIVHSWDDMTAVIAIPACKLLKIKFVNGMVTNTPTQKNIGNKYWLRAKLTFPFSDIIIGNSRAGLNAYSAPARKSLVIPNGYNFERSKLLDDKIELKNKINISTLFVVGMVATFSVHKDYKTYFEAASLLLDKRDDVTFLAIGDKTDSLLSQDLIKNKNFKKNFRLLGKKSNIESYINIVDIGVLATFTEGISNSIMEFMALGKPVVATEGGGTIELIENNITGYLVKVSDAQDLANKIEILLNEAELRTKFGNLGRERIKNHFSIEIMNNKFVSLYKSLLIKN